MAEHRVPMLGGTRFTDPSRSSDPRVRELVTALGTLDPAPPMRPHFRAELRAQLVAVTPRLVAEGEPTVAPAARTATGSAPAAAAARRRWQLSAGQFGRPFTVAAAVLTTLVMLLGGGVLLSRHALPGDALYGVKRASEDVQYAATSGDVDRGTLKAAFAARRIAEARALLPQSASGGSPAVLTAATAGLVGSTLRSADGDVTTAAQLLGAAAVSGRTAGPLTTLATWAVPQQQAVTALADLLAPGSARTAALQTAALIDRARVRALTLRDELGCGCLDTATTDSLGPVPCTTCVSAPGTPGGSTAPVTVPGLPASATATPRGAKHHHRTHRSGSGSTGTGSGTGGGGTGQGGTSGTTGNTGGTTGGSGLQGTGSGLPTGLPTLPGLPGLPKGSSTPQLPTALPTALPSVSVSVGVQPAPASLSPSIALSTCSAAVGVIGISAGVSVCSS